MNTNLKYELLVYAPQLTKSIGRWQDQYHPNLSIDALKLKIFWLVQSYGLCVIPSMRVYPFSGGNHVKYPTLVNKGCLGLMIDE